MRDLKAWRTSNGGMKGLDLIYNNKKKGIKLYLEQIKYKKDGSERQA